MNNLRAGAHIARALAVGFIALVFAGPLFFMVSGSLRVAGIAPPDGLELLPEFPTWDNYGYVSEFVPLWRSMRNSLIVALVAVPVTLLVASLAGFAVAVSSPSTRRRLLAISVLALMVPAIALWVPRFVVFQALNLTDTLGALVAPALMATTPFYVLILALAYRRVPSHLYESAVLDGLSPLGVWRKVALPLAKPATFAVATLAFAAYWSSYVEPLLYIFSPEKATASLTLGSLQTLEPSQHPIMLAASVIVTAPPIIAFLLTQRTFFVKTLDLT